MFDCRPTNRTRLKPFVLIIMETDIRSLVSVVYRAVFDGGGSLISSFQPCAALAWYNGGCKQPLNTDPHSIWKNKRIDYG